MNFSAIQFHSTLLRMGKALLPILFALLILVPVSAQDASSISEPTPSSASESEVEPGTTQDAQVPIQNESSDETISTDSSEDQEVQNQVIRGDRVTFAGSIVIPEDVTLRGDLVILFGDAEIYGTVRGDIVCILCSLHVEGTLERELVTILSELSFTEDAVINGNFVNVLGGLDNAGARFNRAFNNLSLPGVSVKTLLLWVRLLGIIFFFVSILAFTTFIPERLTVISEETPHAYIKGFIVGLLIKIVLGLTAFGFLIGYPIYLVLLWLGRAALLRYMGHRIGQNFGLKFSLLGSIFVGFIPYLVMLFAPFFLGQFLGIFLAIVFHILLFVLVDLPGLGLVFLTRFGTQNSVSSDPPAPDPVAPRDPPSPIVESVQ